MMEQSTSLLQDLMQSLPQLKAQVYFKSALTAISHAMEDLVIDGKDQPLVIANFQQERFYRQETQRYQRIADQTDHVYVLAVPETAFDESPGDYATIGLDPADELAQEWHLVIVGKRYCASLICREHAAPVDTSSLDTARQFRGFWTFDPMVSRQAALHLLQRILRYRPDLASAIHQAKRQYQLNTVEEADGLRSVLSNIDVQLFSDRLVTYLQANQYKQVKAYRRVVEQERQARLVNQVTSAVRQSLQPEEVLAVAVREIGQIFGQGRCLIYQMPIEASSWLEYEALGELPSLLGQAWSMAHHPYFRFRLERQQTIAIAEVRQDAGIQADRPLLQQLSDAGIAACLLVPICYQQQCLAVLELHRAEPYLWSDAERNLLGAIADPIGVALIQAVAYVNMMQLNQKLTAIEQAQNSLIAIVGHELRTPLSTIQVCLESLVESPEMSPEYQQVMLDTALADSHRLRQLVQDFLLLSRLEGNLVNWQLEPIDLTESIALAINSLSGPSKPNIKLDLPSQSMMLICDGEALQQLLNRLLGNAYKFTPMAGEITISATILESSNGDRQPSMIQVVIADTGCGIESQRLETIFERFYQEEEFLQRSVGGTGLGLAICRRLIQRMGGQLWATSAGKGQGSQFNLVLPLRHTSGTIKSVADA
jgi:DICT domain-containing protein/GAF domain-containing protein